jgi:hypothetical protein
MGSEVRMVVGSVKEITNAIFFGNNTTKAAHIRLLDEKDFSDEKNRNLEPYAKPLTRKNFKTIPPFQEFLYSIFVIFLVKNSGILVHAKTTS